MASASASAGSRLPGAVTFIPEERLPAVREAFRMFDTAGAGDIALDELAGVLRALRYTVNAEELDWFSEKHGRDGRITYPEVLEVVGTVHNRKRGVKAVLAAFKEFDREGSGTVTTATFRQILTLLGESDLEKGGVPFVDPEMAEELVASADEDDSGFVNYEAWARELFTQADAMRRAGHNPASARKFLKEMAEEKAKGKTAKKKK